MAKQKRVVTRRKKSTKKVSGKFSFTREMIPVMSNGKPEAEFLTKYRSKAWEAFEKAEIPQINEEAWRRTDIRKLEASIFQVADGDSEVSIPEKLLKPVSDKGVGGQITLSPSGANIFLDQELKQKGVIFTDLKTAAQKHPKTLEKILGQIVKFDEDKFTAMTAALVKTGVLLYVPKGISVDKPLQSLFWGSGVGLAHFSHILVWLEDLSLATYLHEFASNNEDGQTLHSGIVEIYVGKGANLNFVEIQSWGNQVWNFTHERARVESDANLDWVVGALGSHLTKNFSEINLVGGGASGRLAGFYFTDGEQHLDHDTQQNHLAPNTTSDLLFKGALKDQSRSVWQGMIYVAPGAQKTDGYQSNPNLILSNDARADSIPGLEIMADDVRCTHGTTVGKIDPNEVFYLNSRGIPSKDAERLIVEGFFDPILKKIPFELVRERMRKVVIDKLK